MRRRFTIKPTVIDKAPTKVGNEVILASRIMGILKGYQNFKRVCLQEIEGSNNNKLHS